MSKNTRYLNSPIRFTLGGEIRKAANTVQNMIDGIGTEALGLDDKEVTRDLVTNCKAILFLTVVKFAFVGGIRFGSGMVVCQSPRNGGWSAPCAVMLGGITLGVQFGAQVVDMIIPLHDDTALAHFSVRGGTHVMLGSELGVALGPLGRSVEATVMASNRSVDTAVSYSHSRGLYSGVTLDGALVSVRDDVNQKFYGRKVEPASLFDGTIRPPIAAEPLYAKLNEYSKSANPFTSFPESGTNVPSNVKPLAPASLKTKTSQYEEFNSEFDHSDDEASRQPGDCAHLVRPH